MDGIRFAVKNDIPDLIKIWEICFGDPVDYIEYFYRENFDGIEIPVYVVDDRPVSMAHMLPASFVNGSEVIPARLGYAGGTLPDYRKNGCFGMVMETMLSIARENGYVFFFKPSKPEQFEYYNSFGCKKDADFKVVDIICDASETNKGSSVIRDLSPEEYNRLRDDHFGVHPYVKWSDKHLRWCVAENAFCGGKTIAIESHFLMGLTENGVLRIIETDLSVNELRKYSRELCELFKAGSIKAYLPDYSCDEGKEIVSSYVYNAPLNNTYVNLILI